MKKQQGLRSVPKNGEERKWREAHEGRMCRNPRIGDGRRSNKLEVVKEGGGEAVESKKKGDKQLCGFDQ